MEQQPLPFTSASSLFIGMDVHKKTVVLCVYESNAGVRN